MIDHLQNLTFFKPNPNQLKYLEACLNPEVEPTITARCAHAGISRDTFYRWNQDSSFREWLFNKLEELMKEELKEVWGAILKEAKAGNVMAQKLFLERFDPKYREYRADREVGSNILNIGDSAIKTLDIEELKKLRDMVGLPRPDSANIS